MFRKKKLEILKPQISFTIEDDVVVVRAAWPTYGEFDKEFFLNTVFMTGGGNITILNYIIMAIGRFGDENDDVKTAKGLIELIRSRFEANKNKPEENRKDKGLLLKPSMVHQHHFVANKLGTQD